MRDIAWDTLMIMSRSEKARICILAELRRYQVVFDVKILVFTVLKADGVLEGGDYVRPITMRDMFTQISNNLKTIVVSVPLVLGCS